MKKWMEEHPNYKKEHKLQNRELYQQYSKKWRTNNKEKTQEYSKKWRAQNRDYIKKKCSEFHLILDKLKLSLHCMNPHCPYHTKEIDGCCLDFHHLKEKKYSITAMASRNKKAIIAEINKCIVLCSNCHRRVTYKKLDVSNFTPCKITDLSYR